MSGAYNVASGQVYTIGEMALALREGFGVDAPMPRVTGSSGSATYATSRPPPTGLVSGSASRQPSASRKGCAVSPRTRCERPATEALAGASLTCGFPQAVAARSRTGGRSSRGSSCWSCWPRSGSSPSRAAPRRRTVAPTTDQAALGTVILVPGYGGGTDALEQLAATLQAAGRQTAVLHLAGDGTGDLRGGGGAAGPGGRWRAWPRVRLRST